MNILQGIHSRGDGFINTPLLSMTEMYARAENRPPIHYTSIGCLLLITERWTMSWVFEPDFLECN